MNKMPWDFHSDLKEEHIIAIANLIVRVRGEVADLHNPALGDTRLSMGVRAYECCRMRIIREAEAGTYNFLSTLTNTGRFTFRIGEVPVRFVRNNPDELPDHKLIPSDETLTLWDFAELNDARDVRWFFVIESEYDQPADNIYFVGYSELGEIVSKWTIPRDAIDMHVLYDLDEDLPEPIELDKAIIKLKSVDKKQDKEDG